MFFTRVKKIVWYALLQTGILVVAGALSQLLPLFFLVLFFPFLHSNLISERSHHAFGCTRAHNNRLDYLCDCKIKNVYATQDVLQAPIFSEMNVIFKSISFTRDDNDLTSFSIWWAPSARFASSFKAKKNCKVFIFFPLTFLLGTFFCPEKYISPPFAKSPHFHLLRNASQGDKSNSICCSSMWPVSIKTRCVTTAHKKRCAYRVRLWRFPLMFSMDPIFLWSFFLQWIHLRNK